MKEVQAAAQERLARLLSSSPAVIYSFKATGDFAPTFVSDNIIAVFGYAPAEYLEDPSFWRDRVHPDDLARVEDAIARFFRERGPRGGVSLSPQGWLLLLGERRAASDPRRRRQDRGDRRVVERHHGAQGGRGGESSGACPPVPVARQLARGDLQLQGDGGLRADLRQSRTSGTGWVTSRESTWRTPDFWRRCVHPDDLAAVEAESVHLFKKGRHTVEYRFLRKDGSYCWVNDEQRLIRDEDGQPAEVVGSWSDISERKRAEEAAAAARARVEHLLASSPAVIYSFKATGDFAPTFVSQNIKDLLGYEPREYLESPAFWREPRPSRRPAAGRGRVSPDSSRTGATRVEYRFRKKDGSYCWVSDEQHLIRDASGRPSRSSDRGATSRRARQRRRRRPQRRTASVASCSPARRR